MFEVQVESGFFASHAVHQPDGNLEPVHWHHWRVQTVFESPRLNEHGYVVDFVVALQHLERILAPLQGRHLNEHPMLGGHPPTAEHLASAIARRLQPLDWKTARCQCVIVHEAAGCCARVRL